MVLCSKLRQVCNQSRERQRRNELQVRSAKFEMNFNVIVKVYEINVPYHSFILTNLNNKYILSHTVPLVS